jgi:conjugal transfer pilin signal peptidase TrbI
MADKVEVTRSHPLAFAIKMIWVAIAMILVFKLGVGWFVKHYHFMVDTQDEKCIPEYSVYLISKNPVQIEHGKIYAFSAKGMQPFFQDNTIIGKYASALEGDSVSIQESGVFVNDVPVTEGYLLASKININVSDLYKTFTVPKNKIFFTGSAPKSYDSRYWGLADQSQIIGEAIPLW